MKPTTIDIPAYVHIPTSELGKTGAVGRVIEFFGSDDPKIKVDFDGRIGIYTIAKHVIEEAIDAN